MIQGSPEWHAWRLTGIGASDSAQIMERSPYGTRLDLWKIKTKREKPNDFLFSMQLAGKETEDLLRAKHSTHRGRNFQPQCAFHDDFPFMLASLDGYDEKTGEAVEMKFVGKEKYENINEAAHIPDHHKIQLQHQMFVLGMPRIEYLMSCDRGQNYKAFTVEADPKFQKEILAACKKFWAYVQKDKQPPFGPDDFREIKDKITLKLIAEFKELKEKEAKGEPGIKKFLDLHKTAIRARLKYPKMQALGVNITPSGFRMEKAVKADSSNQSSEETATGANPTA